MGTIRGLLKCWVALLLGGLVIAAPASASSAFQTLFNAYRNTGTIATCKYSASELQSAESEVPPDVAQYSPDFPAALQAALQARARGVCGGAGNSAAPAPKISSATPKAPAPPSPPGVTPSPTPSAPAGASVIAAAAAAAPTGGGSGTGQVALIVVAALMACLAAAAVWWTVGVLRGREPAWMGSAGHALGEVRLRAGGALREFADWIRLGR
jgi:hypothetical protein